MTGTFEPPVQERGAALLSVLILVGVLGALAVIVFDRLRLATMLASNSAGIAEARSQSAITEALLAVRIGDLVAANPARTTLAGGWHDRVTPLPLPAGSAAFRVNDGGNCFNLNSLVEGNAIGRQSRPMAIDQFAQLLQLLGVPGNQARQVAAATADWIDSDSQTNPDGAEDSVYARRVPRYRTANALMAEASEWRVVAGVTPALYAMVRPLLCALPVADLSPINVNTLVTRQAPLVAMLFPGTLGLGDARRVIAERPEAGWGSAAEFWNTPTLKSVTPTGVATQQIRVNTTWFAVDLHLATGSGDLRETALFDARQSPVRLARRRWTVDE